MTTNLPCSSQVRDPLTGQAAGLSGLLVLAGLMILFRGEIASRILQRPGEESLVVLIAGSVVALNTWRFVSAGLTNFVRTVRRRENRLDRTVSMEHLQATLEGGRCDKATWPETSSEENNPAQAADTRDLLCLVASILSGFDVRSQILWQRFVTGQKEKQVAAEFGVTCRTVKRWRAELMRELARELGKRL